MINSGLIAPHLQAFFADYLCQQKRMSPQTIISYRDTFRLLLTFIKNTTGIEPCALRVIDLDACRSRIFMQPLEDRHDEGCGVGLV